MGALRGQEGANGDREAEIYYVRKVSISTWYYSGAPCTWQTKGKRLAGK